MEWHSEQVEPVRAHGRGGGANKLVAALVRARPRQAGVPWMAKPELTKFE
jgi:hypothetical protein